jgi:hypothetical protein
MSSQPTYYQDREDSLGGTREELLEVLLQIEDKCYPWNPANRESEAFFAELELNLLPDWQDEPETQSSSEALFNQMHEKWAALSVSTADTLEQSLSERFANFIPQAWLVAIANRACATFSTNLSFAEQLVQCVKPLLPNWTDEDLFVMARPLAYAMRGNSTPSRSVEWTELSQMEQVRLSLTVAHSALIQLQEDTENLDPF